MTTPQRFDHTDDGFETANDGDFVSYDDYAALLARAEQAEARERALIETAETNRKALLKHNADNAVQIATLKAREAELEAALKATLEREAETQRRHDARVAELEAERDAALGMAISIKGDK
jgi:hypothetical protein